MIPRKPVFSGTEFTPVEAQAKPTGAFEQSTDPRVLDRATVRKLLQVLHPDTYGNRPELAAELFQFFKDYEAKP